jgi:hypothetical protein
MGWTSYHAEFYKNGTVDRKKKLISFGLRQNVKNIQS